jgi:hypothetical protein
MSGAPGAGSWNIGVCVDNLNQTDLDNNDYSIGTAFVSNATFIPPAPPPATMKALETAGNAQPRQPLGALRAPSGERSAARGLFSRLESNIRNLSGSRIG